MSQESFEAQLAREVAWLRGCGPAQPTYPMPKAADDCDHDDVRFHEGHDENQCLDCAQAQLDSLRAYLADPGPYYPGYPAPEVTP